MAPRNHKNWISAPKVEYISSDCYNSYEVYRAEQEQIFSKVWVPMCPYLRKCIMKATIEQHRLLGRT